MYKCESCGWQGKVCMGFCPECGRDSLVIL